ncbi:metallophosphoesterase [Rhodoblastus acidophilus]|uniref:Metallophosphoesterase n=1 Tax=Candidatus Rhodoblastus alkanivorans TaxID=2954117 RepID=A0ABS9ZA67_9HYPH|nr:metallophosphoesterase [Candidatus Rhodoblastus alkanivorans]MCI4679281.1 metallophosphoesterase [Candidatus Rhodoblastus alkanivorans]MCI4684092.1 metallophosphoesterase [Candidatus Rhodoblastus alkanivorans]MDI4641412.1 metallophosphoesterase [Rhodoblastus acidophilus]
MIDRRRFLSRGLALPLLGASTAVYAIGIEPNFILKVKRYALTPAGWPAGLHLRFAVISDIHAGEPFMSAARIRRIAQAANALNPDAVLLLGDFNAGHFFVTRAVDSQQVGEALSALRAPLGCYAVLGNHDWWHGPLLTSPSDGTVAIRRALRQAGIVVLENDAVALAKDGKGFWIVGLADQLIDAMAQIDSGAQKVGGDDLDGALAKVSDDAPVILLAHEPMIFRSAPQRIALTLCGHTHGGQVNLPLLGPVVGDLRFGADFVYGHVELGGRNMIISGGLGESVAPVRFLRPPEIVEVELGAPANETAQLSGL